MRPYSSRSFLQELLAPGEKFGVVACGEEPGRRGSAGDGPRPGGLAGSARTPRGLSIEKFNELFRLN